ENGRKPDHPADDFPDCREALFKGVRHAKPGLQKELVNVPEEVPVQVTVAIVPFHVPFELLALLPFLKFGVFFVRLGHSPSSGALWRLRNSDAGTLWPPRKRLRSTPST